MAERDYKATFHLRIQELIDRDDRANGSPERFAALYRLPPRNMGRYYNGTNLPRLDEAVRIAENVGVSLDWLVGLSDPNDDPEGDPASRLGPDPGPDSLDAAEVRAGKTGKRRGSGSTRRSN